MTTQSRPTLAPPTVLAVRIRDVRDPAYQAFLLLRSVFTIAPVFGSKQNRAWSP